MHEVAISLDRDAGFEELYRREYDPMVRLAVLLVGRDGPAQEAVHDSFAKVYERWDKLDNPGGTSSTTPVGTCARPWSTAAAMCSGARGGSARATAGGGSGSTEQTHLVDGKEVTLRVDTADPTRVYQASWIDPSGDGVSLVPAALAHMNVQRAGGSGPVGLAGSAQSLPTVTQALEAAGRIRPVDDASWLAALMPPDGAVDARTGATVRPLRLGLPDELEAMRISNLSPWTEIGVGLGQLAQPTSIFRLRSVALDSPGAGEPVEPPELERVPVAVRGVSGVYVANMVNGTLTEFGHRLVWEEAGSRVEIWGSADHTAEDLVVFADSLVVLDDAQWEQVLLIGADAGADAEEGEAKLAMPVEGLTLDTTSPDYLPPLAPIGGVDWRITSFTTDGLYVPTGYQEDFVADGTSWRLMVQPGPAIEQPGVPVQIGDRSVLLLGGTAPADPVGAAQWTDPSGAFVMLMVLDVLDPGHAVEAAPTFDGLTGDQVSHMVEQIQPVPADAWFAALSPPDRLADPTYAGVADDPSMEGFDSTRRPLKLGLRDQAAPTRLYVQPWDLAQLYLAVDGFSDESFRLGVQSTDLMGFHMAPPSGTSTTVRGHAATLVTHDQSPAREASPYADFWDTFSWVGLSPAGFNRALTWEEDGSTVRLEFKDDVTLEQAVAVAESLVVLDDPEWAALLGFEVSS